MASPLTISRRMKTIGIIGGSTNVATAEYYSLINAAVKERLGGYHTAKIIINSMDLATSVHYVHNNLWEEGAKYLNDLALSLERAGADFIICVSNTWSMHEAGWMKGVTIPHLHICDVLATAIKAKGLKKVTLLGTKATMSSDYVPNALARHGIETLVPTEAEQDEIDRIIFDELSYARFTDQSRQFYLGVVDRLSQEGAQGAMLACTEIGLLIKQEARPEVPFFDTLNLHAVAAAERAVGAVEGVLGAQNEFAASLVVEC